MEENIQQKGQAQIDTLITRDDLLKENDYKFESPIPRYIAFECGDEEVAMWAIQEDDLTSLARSIDESSTKAAEIWAYDLDTGERLHVCQRVVSFVNAKTQERIDIPAPVAPRAFISIEKGLVHDVAADCPLRLRIIDYDTQYSHEYRFVDIPQGDGRTEKALLSEWQADSADVARVEQIFAIPLADERIVERSNASSPTIQTDLAPAASVDAEAPPHEVSPFAHLRNSLKAFLLGMREYRRSYTTRVEGYEGHYDKGRDWAHRLTLRRFES